MTDPSRSNFSPSFALRAGREKSGRGRLGIFLGMCRGVGKTQAMLEAAIQLQSNGAEVLAGAVDTHGCQRLETLLRRLPAAPSSDASLNLDEILLWHPSLALIDDLACANPAGCRHSKRWQDALELLYAGVNVYATLNVHDVESCKDVIAHITGRRPEESVPDTLLDAADELTLVDVTPEQFFLRTPEYASAPDAFSCSGLAALREMALRLVAEHADRRLRELRRAERVSEPWKAAERLMVAVSPSPSSEKLIRSARRIAGSMEATWLAVHVDTPNRVLSDADQARLGANLALARQLGAEVVMAEGPDVGPALLRAAREHNVSQIILGKPIGRRWQALLRPSPVDWLARHGGEIDIQLVRAVGAAPAQLRAGAREGWKEFAFSAAAGAGVFYSASAAGFMGPHAVLLVCLLALVPTTMRFRRRPAMLYVGLSAALWVFRWGANWREASAVGIYLLTGLLIAHVMTRLREREHAERRSEIRATTLYRFTRALAASHDLSAAITVALEEISRTFGAAAALFLRDETGKYTGEAHPAGGFAARPKDEEVAAWVFRNRQPAGRFTETEPDMAALHLPLLAGDEMQGVLAVRFPEMEPLPPHRRELLDAFASQLALTIQKERLLYRIRTAELAAQSERLQKTLLDGVSHELKTPLTAISTALEQESPDVLRREVRVANTRLKRIVGNLLDMTRLETGALQLNREWCDVGELIQGAIECAGEAVQEREIRREFEPDLDPIHVDAGLIEQALANLLANAAAYTKGGIDIVARREGARFALQVADQGPGLQPGEEERIFEKFYRSPGSPAGGVGLGLSIVRRLIEAHGGTITAANREQGGAVFSIRLPVDVEFKLPVESSE